MESVKSLLFILFLVFSFFNTAQAKLFKCKDENNHIIYSDRGCLKTTKQDLYIVIPSLGSRHTASFKQNAPLSENRRSNKSIHKKLAHEGVKKQKKLNEECQSYLDRTEIGKKKLRSGYTTSEGKRIQNKIDKNKRLFDKNCK